jgi:hypothetical protein
VRPRRRAVSDATACDNPRMICPRDVAQAQLDAYNAHDLDGHCAHFSDDVKVADLNGAVSVEGIASYRARYAKLFADFPANQAELMGRVVVGSVVIDHERVRRTPTSEPFEVAAIYTIANGRIQRVDFVK